MQLTTHSMVTDLSDWKDQRTFTQDHPQFERSQISYLMRQRFVNGLEDFDVVRKVGRKLYIHERRFSIWLDHLGMQQTSFGKPKAEAVSDHG